MISRPRLLSDLRERLAVMESDLRSRCDDPGLVSGLRSEWESARKASRTAVSYETWRDERVTQAGAAWLLGTVLLRFCEDNGLIGSPYLAGPGGRLAAASERQQEFFRRNPDFSDRDWIVSGFDEISKASAMTAGLFDHRHNPMWQITPSHQAARDLIAFWRTERKADSTTLVYDFTDPNWDTHLLGDLYQDLSEREKSTYALVQTPEFVEEFILDHTLQPAIRKFGLEQLRTIDPACGSGHFLLGAFHRLLDGWQRQAPDMDPWDRVARVFASLHGVDKNPFAVSITRFRLIIAAMKAGGASRFTDAPVLRITVAIGDSLLYGREVPAATRKTALPGFRDSSRLHWEDVDKFANSSLLEAGTYHAVFGNPPYIIPRDKAEAETYRALYPACTGAYALTVPFITRFFGLARHGGHDEAGYVGLLTSNSFMKREFGRRLVEQFFPTVDLTHVVDTSGVFIPGHGVPTVILFGRNQRPQHGKIDAIVGLRGEPEVPRDPARGHVWQSILGGIGHVTYEDSWTQGFAIDRADLSSFPWNLANPTTAYVLRTMNSGPRLGDRVARIGYFASTGSDELFTAPPAVFRRIGAEKEPLIPVLTGSGVRDWVAASEAEGSLFAWASQRPTDTSRFPRQLQRLWPYRTVLGHRPNYSGRSYFVDHRPWYEWHHITEIPHTHPWHIAFPWVSTHNHFAVLRMRSAPLNSAPVIQLPDTASDSDVLQLAALLNSSLACFWLKQNSNSKGQPRADQTGSGEPWTLFYEFTASRLGDLPLPPDRWSKDRWTIHAEELDRLAQELAASDPQALLRPGATVANTELDAARSRWGRARTRLISLQEELDWEIYRRYGLVSDEDRLSAANLDDVPELEVGERAFEIVLARRMAAGNVTTQWFERHGAAPITEIPAHWPRAYRETVERRIAAIGSRTLALPEKPEYKRRWATKPWDKRERDAIRAWLLDRCEDSNLWYEKTFDGGRRPRPLTLDGLAEKLREDRNITTLAGRYAGDRADMAKIVAEIINAEHVPYLAALRLTGTGMTKREGWTRTWALQRQEDSTGQHLNIPVPPRYTSSDFRNNLYWANRGKLDVPRERFISYPLVNAGGNSPLLIGWAGWNHAERARVLIEIIDDSTHSGINSNKYFVPLLAGLQELFPWLQQWHTNPEPPFWKDSPPEQTKEYLATFRAKHGLQAGELASWRPPSPKRGRPRKS